MSPRTAHIVRQSRANIKAQIYDTFSPLRREQATHSTSRRQAKLALSNAFCGQQPTPTQTDFEGG